RKRRLKEELPKKIKEIREEINKREREEVKLPTGDIKEAREDVKRLLEAFFKKEEPCKAIALLHSAGSGKTSNLREMILKQEGKHIVLYMATRLSLLDREHEKLKERKDKNLSLVYVRGQKESKWVNDKGHDFKNPHPQKGKLLLTVEKILKEKEKNPDYIWAFLTIQAIVETAYGNKTSKHLRDLLKPTILKDYHIHIVLDEFFGYKNGLFAITEMFEFLKEVKQRRGRASLYMFDANGYSPNLLEKLIVEYKEFEVIPESIVLAQYQEEIKTHYEGIPFEIYAKHGYPAKALLIHKKFFEVKKEEEMPSLVAKYIKKTLKEGSTAFAFIQNKELIVEIERELSNLGLTSLIATASSKKSQEQINKGEEDVILGTSSVSRGLDFSRPHKPVDYIYIVVNAWGIENNLVETIQAISRSRGDEKTEEREKHIHLIYLINDQYLDWAVDKISSTLDHPDKELVELVYKKEQLEGFLDLDDVLTMILEQFLHKPSRNVLVPVPTQQRSQYRPNTFKEYEEVVSFLEDVHYMERGEDLYKFLKELTKWGYISTDLPRNLENTKDFKYYHPYILYEEKALHSHFDNDIRKKLEPYLNKLKSELEEHNPEKAKKVEDFVKKTVPTVQNISPLLLPIYSFVFVKNYLKKDQKLSFRISKRVGRGHADVLGGGLEPKTLCAAKEREEYACIPLGEDYPYKEVLSGRFAKFPVKFIKSLLEG
ncbi:MAG: helicase, partial [Aquificaceae bacterium]